jgi:hypothetical protein
MPDPDALRQLAAWYRKFAERAGNPTIGEMRLDTAERLEAEAMRIELRRPGFTPLRGSISHLIND